MNKLIRYLWEGVLTNLFLLCFCINAFAASKINSYGNSYYGVGDVIDSEDQVEIDGVKYPVDGAVVIETIEIGNNFSAAAVFDDGTTIIGSYAVNKDWPNIPGENFITYYEENTYNNGVRFSTPKDRYKVIVRQGHPDFYANMSAQVDMYVYPRTENTYCSVSLEDIDSLTICEGAGDINISGARDRYICPVFECASLNTLRISDYYGSIGSYYTGDVVLPSVVKCVGKYPNEVPKVGVTGISNVNNVSFKDGCTDLGDFLLMSSKAKSITVPDTVERIGKMALKDCACITELNLPNLQSIGDKALQGVSVERFTVPESCTSVGKDVFGTSFVELIYNAEFGSSVASATGLKKLYLLGGISNSAQKAWIPPSCRVYCLKDSDVHTWCENQGVPYTLLDQSEVEEIKNGTLPTLVADSKLFDAEDPSDLVFEVDLGKKPAGADGIAKVMVDNATLPTSEYEFDGTSLLTLKSSYASNLSNGSHAVSVLFDNAKDTFRSGASITVINSKVSGGSGSDSEKPPEALTTITYEFYKDYPDYVIIPVKMNGATKVTSMKIGTADVPESSYGLQDGAIIIDPAYMATLDAAKYRVLPTFDDKDNTTISNIRLVVYDKAADRGAPYLLQSRIVFSGQDLALAFDPGYGETFASDVAAIVIDKNMYLSSGRELPFNSSNFGNVQTAMFRMSAPAAVDTSTEEEEKSEPDEVELVDDIHSSSNAPASASNASASNAGKSERRSVKKNSAVDAIMSFMSAVDNDRVFTVEDTTIHVDGEFISSLNLPKGDHLVGAVFLNNVYTTDLKKVVLTIPEDDDPGTGEDKPGPGEGGTATKPGEGGTNKPGGSGGSGGGSGTTPGGPGVVVFGQKNDSDSNTSTVGKNDDGSWNSKYTSNNVPNSGGTFVVNEDGTKKYIFPDGATPTASWVGDGKDWYHVEADGSFTTGWWLDSNSGYWYQLCEENGTNYGAMRYGWYYEQSDGKWYFMSPIDGSMLTGWQFIDGLWYYFTVENDGQTYFGSNETGWVYQVEKRPYGSMYADEITPDNYSVNKEGVYVR